MLITKALLAPWKVIYLNHEPGWCFQVAVIDSWRRHNRRHRTPNIREYLLHKFRLLDISGP